MFAIRLKQLREAAGLSQAELGAKLKTTQQTINNYEKGKREPGQAMIQSIADLFNVSIDYLYGRTDDPTPPKAKKKQLIYEEYVKSAPTLAEGLLRVSEAIAKYHISTTEAMRLSDLVFDKFGAPPAVDTDEAAHLECDIPGTGALDDDDEDDSNGKGEH